MLQLYGQKGSSLTQPYLASSFAHYTSELSPWTLALACATRHSAEQYSQMHHHIQRHEASKSWCVSLQSIYSTFHKIIHYGYALVISGDSKIAVYIMLHHVFTLLRGRVGLLWTVCVEKRYLGHGGCCANGPKISPSNHPAWHI